MLLEVCTNSYQSVLNAQAAGAQRIELCEKLSIGGVTPRRDLIKQALDETTSIVFVLIRPRGGNFVYTDKEFEMMKQHISLYKDLGCHGIVSGVLNGDNTIDLKRTKELINIAKPLPFTFHRAFDLVNDPIEALERLIVLDVDRVLTSGQETTAEKGIELLNRLNQIAKERIIILPGGGIHTENINLFKQNNFAEVHSSARKIDSEILNQEGDSNKEIIQELLAAIS